MGTFGKYYHEFKDKIIIELKDKIETADGETHIVESIQVDGNTLKTSFKLSGVKKAVLADSLHKQITSGKSKHKSHRGFFAKLLGKIGSGPEHFNALEFRAFVHEKIQRENPEVWKRFQAVKTSVAEQLAEEDHEESYDSGETASDSISAPVNSNSQSKPTEVYKGVVKELNVKGNIEIHTYTMAGGGWVPVWGVSCSNCGTEFFNSMIGNLGRDTRASDTYKTCPSCKAINHYSPKNTHWSHTALGTTYSG